MTPEHSDQGQDVNLIKQVLQKVIDDMNGLEANRITPEHKRPGYSAGSLGIEKPNENTAETPEEAEPEDQDNQHAPLDPEILKTLMDRAGEADETGATPEDNFEGLTPEIADLVRKKRAPVKE